MVVYISGKIGTIGVSDECREKFLHAEKELKKMGYEVFNPTAEVWQESLKKGFQDIYNNSNDKESQYAYFLALDLFVLSNCDTICMLKDFRDSPGAKAEYAFAIAAGKKNIYEEELFRELNETW